ncbi:FUSC family protein [Nonomuraea wenchangensis]|uniref:FUSC family protein n=1 Tax=Nonomuraea wenchangensis TaxID=568860 RepID=UPI0033C0FA04
MRSSAFAVRLPVLSALRLAPLGDVWHKPAFSSVVALLVVLGPLVAAGRLDLVLYGAAGAMCALYGHGLPYRARAGALAWVVAGMLTGVGIALVTAALTDAVAVRVAVAAVLAGLHKAVCDATRIGPPGNVVLTFLAASAAFVPQRLADVPLHVGVGVLGGVVAWAVGMAPWLVRRDGPERVAVARALEATARLLRARQDRTDGVREARHAAAAAVNAAWQTLLRAGAGREELRGLLVRAESGVSGGVGPEALRGWARELREGRPVPVPPAGDRSTAAAERAELAGIAAEESAGRGLRGLARDVAGRWRVVVMVFAGSAAAGWGSMAFGVGRPYWAVVTAASVFAASTAMSWSRAVQRVVGNLLGVALFTVLAPVTRLGAVALLVTVLALQFVTERAMTRNYWLGSVFVTPTAILMTQFAGTQPVPVLVADRWLDTCLGAVAGLVACVVLRDRRAAGRVHDGLERLERLVAEPRPAADRLRAALVGLREAADLAAGEWRGAALPEERIVAAERAGHRRLAELTAGPDGRR